tara:strand:- start:22 stop:510 length:489 start_codon:yes stop_codon:yes gene_type:complete
MSQLNTNIIKGVQDNDDVVIKTNNTTRITFASGGDTLVTALSAPSVSAVNTCKAWVNFNGQSTPAIRTSYNVSSISDEGTGSYIIIFTQPMTDANYVIAGHNSSENSTSGSTVMRGSNGFHSVNPQASGAHIVCAYGSKFAGGNSDGAANDVSICAVSIFGN